MFCYLQTTLGKFLRKEMDLGCFWRFKATRDDSLLATDRVTTWGGIYRSLLFLESHRCPRVRKGVERELHPNHLV